jgi:formate hydrogenlyase transcriptional activator
MLRRAGEGGSIARKARDSRSRSGDLQETRPRADLEKAHAELGYLRKLFDSSNDMILILDPERDRILDANRRACATLGYEREELLDTPISAIHPDEMPQLLKFCRSVESDGSGYTEELSCLTKSGGYLPAEISASLSDFDGATRIVAFIRDASRRHKAERALRESEERFRDLYEEAPLMYFSVGADGRILRANQQVTRVLGYPLEELIGHPVSQIWWSSEEARRRSREIFRRFMAGEEILDEEVEVRSSDGRRVWGSLSVKPIWNSKGAVVASRSMLLDITPRKQAEQALRESERRLAGILASAMDAIITMDRRMRISLFNEAAEKVFGCSSSEAVGTSFDRFASPAFQEIIADYLKISGMPERTKGYLWCPEGLTAIRTSGEEFPVEATLSKAEVRGEELYTLILRDLDDRRKTEAKLRRLEQENLYLQEEIRSRHHFEEVVGVSPAIRKVLRLVEKVAEAETTVLITGETGTGKELIARALHARSRRSARPLISINCAALPPGLIESELFGHEKGAFTGAVALKPGRFELADGGTLFLDEVGELPSETQVKLLRVLQEWEFERVGGTRSIRVDVRVIAATNRNLEEEVRERRFRSDLFYRLNVFPISLPPLRERSEDVPLLLHYFVDKYAARVGRRIDRVRPDVLKRFQAYHWPGNIRELENLVERAMILSTGPDLEIDDEFFPAGPGEPVDGLTLHQMERAHILRVLRKAKWVIEGPSGAARLLDLHPSTLRSRLKKLDIERKSSED